LRCFEAIPTLNADGLHVGGIAGFLKSIGYAIKLIQPDRCVIIFDGPGGSMKRKKLFPEYKAHRKTKIRLNRIYEEHHTDLCEEEKNLKKQLQRTVAYLHNLPINILSLDNVEADDTIAFCATQYFENSIVNIMSTDKDFLQLVDDNIRVWSPSKKKLYGPMDVLTEYGIHPYNFVVFRTLDGDQSDNIPGIRGCGLKTTIKAFPFLAEPRKVLLEEIYKQCENNSGKLKIYDRIVAEKTTVERNYALMQLTETQLSTVAQMHVTDILNGEIPKLNRMEFSKLITEDRMWSNISGYQVWLNEVFGKLNNFVK
jgi:DNA polymerase-1